MEERAIIRERNVLSSSRGREMKERAVQEGEKKERAVSRGREMKEQYFPFEKQFKSENPR